ncbi:MAG: hypothetical protein QM773_09040 [Hyphomonadaceae bacterium]
MKMQIAALAALGLTGCQSVQSEHVDFSSGRLYQGLQYALPKALVTVEMLEDKGVLYLGVSRPFLVGDPEATFMLTASSGLFASQKYRFMVHPQTRLLSYINSVSEGQASAILENLAKSVGGIGALPKRENTLTQTAGTVTKVFSKVIDPFEYDGCDFGKQCSLTKLNVELRERALEFLGCSGSPASLSAGSRDQCARIGANQNYFTITLDPMFSVQSGASTGRIANLVSSCTSSICYRAPAPYRLGVRVAGVRDVSEVVMLPNESPVMSLSLPAGVFATSRSRVELAQGMPATVVIDQGNELVGITAIPLTVINGFFEAVSEVVQLRINFNNQDADLMESDMKRLKAMDDYDEARRLRQETLNAALAADIARRNNATNADQLANTAMAYQEAYAAAQIKANQSAEAADVKAATGAGAAKKENNLNQNSGQTDPLTDAAKLDLTEAQKSAELTTIDTPTPRLFEIPLWKQPEEARTGQAASTIQTKPETPKTGGGQPKPNGDEPE